MCSNNEPEGKLVGNSRYICGAVGASVRGVDETSRLHYACTSAVERRTT